MLQRFGKRWPAFVAFLGLAALPLVACGPIPPPPAPRAVASQPCSNEGGGATDGTFDLRCEGGRWRPNSPVGIGNLTGVSKVAVGRGTCAIVEGALKCWGPAPGAEPDPNLFDPTLATPVTVAGFESGVTDIAMGTNHICAVRNGALSCWGANGSGQLGNGTTVAATTPQPVTGMQSGVTSVSVSANGTCAVKAGAAFCWGIRFANLSAPGSDATPQAVAGWSSGVDTIRRSDGAACAISSGALSCIGNKQIDGNALNDLTPQPIPGLNTNVIDVTLLSSSGDWYLGSACAVIVGSDGRCWGDKGEKGFLPVNTNNSVPPEIWPPGVMTTYTRSTSFVINSGNEACGNYTFPNGEGGVQCTWDGIYSQPLRVPASKVAGGFTHSCAILTAGELRCWGRNQHGQLGVAYSTSPLAPTTPL